MKANDKDRPSASLLFGRAGKTGTELLTGFTGLTGLGKKGRNQNPQSRMI
jgi:hypothetical protein